MRRNGTHARRKQGVLHHFGIPPQGSGTARAGVVVVIIIVVVVIAVLVTVVVVLSLLSLWKPSFFGHEPGPALNAHTLSLSSQVSLYFDEQQATM
jgi:flagellar basal body-associated protein FliL